MRKILWFACSLTLTSCSSNFASDNGKLEFSTPLRRSTQSWRTNQPIALGERFDFNLLPHSCLIFSCRTTNLVDGGPFVSDSGVMDFVDGGFVAVTEGAARFTYTGAEGDSFAVKVRRGVGVRATDPLILARPEWGLLLREPDGGFPSVSRCGGRDCCW
jgi:hypothetical protein